MKTIIFLTVFALVGSSKNKNVGHFDTLLNQNSQSTHRVGIQKVSQFAGPSLGHLSDSEIAPDYVHVKLLSYYLVLSGKFWPHRVPLIHVG